MSLPQAKSAYWAKAILVLALALHLSGCSVTDSVVSSTNSSQPSRPRHLSHVGPVHWSYFWGLLATSPWPAGCPDGSNLSQVRVTTNPGFVIVSFLSLGIAVPQRLEWDCAQVVREPGKI